MRGFSLLEVLIAAVVLTIGVISLSQAFNSGVAVSADAESVDRALSIAQARVEEIKNTAFGSISSGGPTSDANFPNFSTTATVTGTDPKQVAVTVAWDAEGQPTSVTLNTLVANY